MNRPRYLFAFTLFSFVAILLAPVRADVRLAPNTVRIHYHRTNGDYDGWSIYTFTGALHPTAQFSNPDPPTGTDDFGFLGCWMISFTLMGVSVPTSGKMVCNSGYGRQWPKKFGSSSMMIPRPPFPRSI
jgi:hypothetical protein